MYKRIMSIVFLLIVFSVCNATEKPNCTQKEAYAAETEASTLGGWPEVYKSFFKYGHCDDAAIAEGYSETISRLLANDWNDLKVLRRYVSRSKQFEHFVLRHIDGTWTRERVDLVEKNARTRCSHKNRKLCQQILHEISM
jgi:hypothetical protein